MISLLMTVKNRAMQFKRGLRTVLGQNFKPDEIMKSLEWQPTDSPFDLIFLDGDHAYDTVRAELRRYLPLLTPNGLMLLHDLDLDGPAQAFREIAADPHCRAAALGYGGGLGMVSR